MYIYTKSYSNMKEAMDLKDSSHSTHSEDSVIVGILQKCFKYTFSCITQNINRCLQVAWNNCI